MKIIFFGSTSDSVLVLEKLISYHVSRIAPRVCAVVTQPPRPVGRRQVLTPTLVEAWAKAHNIPALSFPSSPSRPSRFDSDQTVIDTLQPFKADLLISASFGQRIPYQLIKEARFGGLNVHPSLLPRWRGADPVPWAIMAGDAQTGVTIVTLSEQFDAGTIIAQKKIPTTDTDMSDPLRTKLFTIGADLLIEVLPNFLTGNHHKPSQHPKSTKTYKNERSLHFVGFPQSYARRLTRDDGFEPWENIQKALDDPQEAKRIDRKFRALTPWPGLWTKVSVRQRINASAQKRRLKIISLHRHTSGNDTMTPYLILDSVQLEGKTPVAFSQFQKAYLESTSSNSE